MDKADAIRLHRKYYTLDHVKEIKARGDIATQRGVACYRLRVFAAGYARHVKIFRPTARLSSGRRKERERERKKKGNENKTIVVRR